MAIRLTVASTADFARAQGLKKLFSERFPRVHVGEVGVTVSYTIDAKLSKKEFEKLGAEFANPAIERFAVERVLAPAKFSQAIEIGFLPGVTDNVGTTARQMIGNALRRKFKDDERVYSSYFVFLSGVVSSAQARIMAAELYNPLIERATIIPFSKFNGGRLKPVVPIVRIKTNNKADAIDLEIPDEELSRLGKEGIPNKDSLSTMLGAGSRRGPLALSLRELHSIRDFFRGKGRDPTDIELESLAQTWSEHCTHTIFNDPLDDIGEGLYHRYIKGATSQIRRKRKVEGREDFCASVFVDNSGAIVFDKDYLITHKVETHNSPSALDPYGGAITGILGVNRDALGFGLGAKPIANVYGFFVGHPNDKREFFRDPPPPPTSLKLRRSKKASGGQAKQRQPLLPARRILEGVVKGINAGGNQSGISTPLGALHVDPRYRGKPLVFAGTVGLIPRYRKNHFGILQNSKIDGRGDLSKKQARPGDLIVMVGGRVGLDGIHGATFSSESLDSGSPATAVQIGDAITQKKLSDAIVREARDKNLYHSITDNGAGGLSCSVAEMAKESGGGEVHLDKVPLKYPGLAPWQTWISESQERMTLAVPKKNWKRLRKIFNKHGSEATVIGRFTDSGKCVVRAGEKVVMDIELSYLYGGRPIKQQVSKKPMRTLKEPPASVRRTDAGKTLLALFARPNIGSHSFISQQYDHEVKGISVTKPLQGRGRVNAEATVIRPVAKSQKGVVLSYGYNPSYSDIDTYHMAAASIDAAVRNAVAAGATLDHLALLDNTCWSSGNSPERLYELKEAIRACYAGAVAYGTPYISGKDSMFNDFKGFDGKGRPVHIAAPPTLLISAIGVMQDVTKAMTIDWKQTGDIIYLLGETKDELGGSEYFAHLSKVAKKTYVGISVPKTDFKKNLKMYRALERAISKGLVSAALALGRGGLAIGLAKCALAGGLGAEVSLKKVRGSAREADSLLFSESQGRVLATVAPHNAQEFERLLAKGAHSRIGEVSDKKKLLIRNRSGRTVVNAPLSRIAVSYAKPFKDL